MNATSKPPSRSNASRGTDIWPRDQLRAPVPSPSGARRGGRAVAPPICPPQPQPRCGGESGSSGRCPSTSCAPSRCERSCSASSAGQAPCRRRGRAGCSPRASSRSSVARCGRALMRLFEHRQREGRLERAQRGGRAVVGPVDDDDRLEVARAPGRRAARTSRTTRSRRACVGTITVKRGVAVSSGAATYGRATTSPSEPETGIGRSPSTPGSTSKNAAGDQSVLNLVARLQEDVDPIAAGQQRQRAELALDPRAERRVAQVAR